MDLGFKIIRENGDTGAIVGYTDTFANTFSDGGNSYTTTNIFYYDTSFSLTGVDYYLNSGNGDVIISSQTISLLDGVLTESGEWYENGDTLNPVSSYEFRYEEASGNFLGGQTVDESGLTTVYDASGGLFLRRRLFQILPSSPRVMVLRMNYLEMHVTAKMPLVMQPLEQLLPHISTTLLDSYLVLLTRLKN